MLEITNTNFSSPRFKSEQTRPNFQSTRMQSLDNDTFELMQAQQKKEKKKEAWQKTGVIAQVGLALAFGTMAITGIFKHKLDKKMVEQMTKSAEKTNSTGRTPEQVKKAAEELKNTFTDLSENKNIVNINDPSLTPEFRKWADEVVAGSKMPESVTNLFGESGSQNMIYMYGGSGTGKTYNADVLFKALGAKRLDKQFSNFSSEYVGKTAVNITNFFEELECLLKNNPNEKFGISLNEFETLAKNVEKMGKGEAHLEQNRTAMLNGLDRVRGFKNLYIVASSNVGPKTGKIDGAIARRFGQNIEITYPTEIALDSSLKTHLQKIEKLLKNDKYDYYKDEKDKIAKFVETLHTRKGGHGDVETIVETAISKAKKSLLDSMVAQGAVKKLENGGYETVNKELANKIASEFKFETKYLEEALADKGKLAGEMGNEFTLPAS